MKKTDNWENVLKNILVFYAVLFSQFFSLCLVLKVNQRAYKSYQLAVVLQLEVMQLFIQDFN